MDLGLIIDVETTGLDFQTDEIIEVGFLEFAVNDVQNLNIVSLYGAVQEPQRKKISPEITNITGITPEMVQGRKIDWNFVREAMLRSSIIIAHNMEFDRSFLQKIPELSGVSLHWACSLKHIDWPKHGFKTKALNYLASDAGFINPFSHRAVFDCATTFRVISPYLEEMIARSYQREYKFSAVSAPFECKDKLKQRGYYWNTQERVWEKELPESDLESERRFLQESIYLGKLAHREVCLSDLH